MVAIARQRDPDGNMTERPVATISRPRMVGPGSDMAGVIGMATATGRPAAAQCVVMAAGTGQRPGVTA